MAKRVMAAGVFDLLHLGHVHYLTEAKKMGDELVVVVATDVMVAKRKHQPIIPQEQRLALVAALKPDVIALGYDDYHRAEEVKAELAKRGMGHVEVQRCPRFDEHDLNGTRKIVRRILDLYDPTGKEGAP